MATKSLNESFQSSKIVELFKKYPTYNFIWNCAKDNHFISRNYGTQTNQRSWIPEGIDALTDDDIAGIITPEDKSYAEFHSALDYCSIKVNVLSKNFPFSFIIITKYMGFSESTPLDTLTKCIPAVVVIKPSGGNKLYKASIARSKKYSAQHEPDGAKQYQYQSDIENSKFTQERMRNGEARDNEVSMYYANAAKYMQRRVEFLKKMNSMDITDVEARIYKFTHDDFESFSINYLAKNKTAFCVALKINNPNACEWLFNEVMDNKGVNDTVYKNIQTTFKINREDKNYRHLLIMLFDALKVAGTMYIPEQAQKLVGDYTKFRQAIQRAQKDDANKTE